MQHHLSNGTWRSVRRLCVAFVAACSLSSPAGAQSLPDTFLRLTPITEFEGFTWVAGSWTELIEAQASAFEYHAEGFEPFIIPVEVNGTTRYRVAFGQFESLEDAVRNRPNIPLNIPSDAWIAEVRAPHVEPVPAEPVEVARVPAAVPETRGARFIWNESVVGRLVDVPPSEPRRDAEPNTESIRRSFFDRYMRDPSRVSFGLLSNYDTNVLHVSDATGSFAYVPVLFVRYRVGKDRPLIVFNYFGARHAYTSDVGRDRWGHIVNATALPDQRGHLRYDTAFQLSRTIESDERQLSDDIQVRHRFEYRFSSSYRLRLYGTMRWERYVDDPEENAFTPNLGMMFRQRIGRGSSWDTEIRWEKNVTSSERDKYRRLTFIMNYSVPVSDNDEIEFEAIHRRRMYDYREVPVGDDAALRRDLRWTIGTSWAREIRPDLRLLTGYHFERRDSNDPRRIYEGHLLDLGLIYTL